MTNQVSEFGTISEFPSIFSGDKLQQKKKKLMAWLTGFIKWYVEATLSFNFSWRWTNDSLWLWKNWQLSTSASIKSDSLIESVVSAVHLMILVF